MSKSGRRPIDVGSVEIQVQGSEIRYKGKLGAGVYVLPPQLQAQLVDKKLLVTMASGSDDKALWGLHRALLSNQLVGAAKKFEKELKIVGLGFKAIVTGNKIQFALGYSHKIDFQLPEGVAAEVDKTGQLLTLRSSDKELLGSVASEIRSFRPPEPYKGTGIQGVTEQIRRKAGKAK